MSSRDQLTKRVLPQLVLSDQSNPLTAAQPRDTILSPKGRALNRFAVHGNAIVTGGAGGLGLEVARGLLEHGASCICLFDVLPSFASAQSAIAALGLEFPSCTIISEVVDVTDEEAVEKAVKRTVETLGSIDILLCFAGIVGCAHAEEMKAEEWRKVMDVNVNGTWFCAQAVGKQMIAQGTPGSIVLTASVSGHIVNFPQPQVAYNASKAAVLHLKNSLAAEWARYGIRVNSISPGYMDTILNKGDGLDEAKKIWYSRIPMGRMGDPTELVGVVVLLCSAAGRYMTGTDIVVDGGMCVF
ncbi:hypothetical protein BDQ12DRAFT_683937 [Crucibulum laeve]|uniref:D-arabinitol 2-dehydrogenase [ribulose-forming] n=1 Tax=Crucibulum laeve TaxID=68775 RepID=A0A5C3LXV9_9AGAR|nr:hypothetical protein BDQ12DRAFT_683937 [Crucibulum laeve]